MLNGFKTQTIRDAEVGPDTAAELAATADARATAREKLAAIEELADAIRTGTADSIVDAQSRVKELAGC